MLSWARRRAGLSQRDLAARAGVTQSTVARIESGVVDPRVGTLRTLLRVCEVDLEALPMIGRGVDATLIREYLRLTARERLEEGAIAADVMEPVRGAARGR